MRCHHSLPLGDQGALGTQTLPVTTLPLVAPQPRDQAVVPAAGAFRSPLFTLRVRVVRVVLRPAPAFAAKHSALDPSSRPYSLVHMAPVALFSRTCAHDDPRLSHLFPLALPRQEVISSRTRANSAIDSPGSPRDFSRARDRPRTPMSRRCSGETQVARQ